MQTSNRYVQLVLLTLLMAVLIYVLLFVIFMVLGIEFPVFLHLTVSILGSGYLVYQYFSRRIG